ncbi:MAG: hypothetical protein IJ420_08250 [Lachnospiraceae bacterium]|nr:hypothetical protein [Lachnospiraceae bacterium]
MDVNTILMTVAAVLMLVSAVLYFITTFFGKGVKKTSKIKEKALDAVTDFSDGEFRLALAKYLKETERAQKELVDIVKKQNTLIQSQIENVEHEIYLLSEKQVNQAKSIIKYNKENARQLAISERETLEYVMSELKKAIEDNAGAVAVKNAEDAAPDFDTSFLGAEETVAPVLEEVSEAELFEVSDLPADEEFVLPDLPAPEEIPDKLEEAAIEEPVTEEPSLEALLSEEIPEIPEIPDDLDLSALFEDIAEAAAEESVLAASAPVAEESASAEPAPAAEEPAPAADPLAGLSADPNAMMTPEDIAKLLEAMGQ